MKHAINCVIIGLSLSLVGCTEKIYITQDLGCSYFRPIRPTAADVEVISQSLADQVLAHNEVGQSRCGWVPGRSGGE